MILSKKTAISNRFLKKGFTLIEIMVALVLLTVTFSFVGLKMFSAGSQIKDSFRFFSSLNRRLYTSARLQKQVYRLVIEINNKAPEKVWVEKKIESPTLKLQREIDEEEKVTFQKDSSILSTPRKISPLLALLFIESTYWEEEKKEGRVYIYYYPRGPGPEVAIHFKKPNSRHEWTLYFPPLQRELRLIKGHVRLQDIKEGL